MNKKISWWVKDSIGRERRTVLKGGDRMEACVSSISFFRGYCRLFRKEGKAEKTIFGNFNQFVGSKTAELYHQVAVMVAIAAGLKAKATQVENDDFKKRYSFVLGE